MEIAGSELGGRESLQVFAEDGFSRGNAGEQLVGNRIGEVIPEERSKCVHKSVWSVLNR